MVNDRSRMNREIHVRFCESLRVKLPRATRLRGWDLAVPAYSIDQDTKNTPDKYRGVIASLDDVTN